jgi:hypothetical protein
MSQKYRMPCTCGATHVVDTTQAGITLVCSCKRRLEVPTIRGLKNLEPVAEKGATAPPAWQVGHGVFFAAGLVVFIAAAVAGGNWGARRLALDTTRPDESSIQYVVDVSKLSPEESIEAFRALEASPPMFRRTPAYLIARHQAAQLDRRLGMALVALVIGAALMGGAFLVSRGAAAPAGRKRPAPSPSRPAN